ncbi:MAG: hypothetical protein B6I29_04840 [Marinitoga sp. 4572_148]|nr:MAG: hypothetical protein B6I29_04840 [Marinitoga sp. 4572_148]
MENPLVAAMVQFAILGTAGEVFFGPWLIIIHRFLDNISKLKVPTDGLKGAMLTLLWFWVPAHTVTFSLSVEWQITLAAVWSFVLGLILGIFSNLKDKKEVEIEE